MTITGAVELEYNIYCVDPNWLIVKVKACSDRPDK